MFRLPDKLSEKNCVLSQIHEIFTLQQTLIKQYGCFKLALNFEKVGSSVISGSQILSFVNHCSANFSPILDCFIPNFKLKYGDPENMKADCLNTLSFSTYIELNVGHFFWDKR